MSRIAKPHKPLPRGCVTLMGLALFLAGVAGLVILWNTLLTRVLRIHSWEAVPCTVLQADTVTKGTDIDGNLVMDVKAEVAWEYKGTRYTGGKLDADTGFYTAESVNAKEEFCHLLRRNPHPACYVNPDNPAEAVLRLPEWWLVGVFAGMALTGIILGAGVMLVSREKAPSSPAPGPGRRALIFVMFLGLMLIAGGAAIWWFGIHGATDWAAIGARMKKVPCTVVNAAVERSGGGRNSSVTYRPKIFYSYEWDGRLWHSQWYDFNKTAPGSSDPDKARAALQPYGRGTTHSCWVDPDQPWVAVLEKTGSGFLWLWIPAGLLFLFGGCFTVFPLKKLKRLRAAAELQPRPGSGPPPMPE